MKIVAGTISEWMFFDLGSTLIDETSCLEYRLRETLEGQPAPVHDGFLKELRWGYFMNQDGYQLALQKFGLKKAPWRGAYEQLYPQTPQVLRSLGQKYHLGVIANQAAGARERLAAWGISGYFDIIVLSCELGISKPDPSIFQSALEQAGCTPERAWMIGDRLDNDILPAMELRMKTVWLKQGWGALGNPDLLPNKPIYTINNVGQLLEIFEKTD